MVGINWQEVSALLVGLGMMGAIFMLVVRGMIRDEIVLAIKALNGTYLRRELAAEKFEQIEKHFDYLRDNGCPILHSRAKNPPEPWNT